MSQIGDEILSKIDIVDIVGKYVSLKKAGVNYTGLCPFHNEKTPSFVVSPQKQIFKCFGCGEGGNAISFFMKIERLDRWEAIQQLSNDYHIDIKKYQKLPPEKIQEYQSEKEKLKYINKLSQSFFLENYDKNHSVKDYVSKTRKLPQNIISKFGLGYAPDSHYTMSSFLKGKGFKEQDLIKSSILKQGIQGESYAFFRNRLTIPIWDGQGKIVAFTARALKKDDMPKYLNTAETLLYKKSEILYGMNFLKDGVKKYKKIIVVEGNFDVIAFHTAGFPIAVATCGTALTKQHISILKRYTDDIYFMFDNDKAGLEATLRGLKISFSENIFPKILSLPNEFKDIDDLVSSYDLQKKSETDGLKNKIEKIIEDGKKGFFWMMEQGLKQYDIASPVEKQKFYNMIFELIKVIDGFSLQQDFLELFANKIGTKYDILLLQYKQFCKNIPMRQKKVVPKKEKKRETDKSNLLQALIFEDFIFNQDFSDNTFIKNLKDLFQKVGEDIFGIQKEKEDYKQKLVELQLRWEKELDNYIENEMKINFIKKTILREVNTVVLQYIKFHKDMKNDQKLSIIDLLNKIKI